jgi:hypothetical protein
MKTSNFVELSLIIFITLSIVTQTVMALAVTQPTLGLRLLRGDSARFNFEIQATMDSKQSCSYSVSGLDPLVISFDENKAVVNAGEIKKVYGTISIPNNAPIKTYPGKLIVSCNPYVEQQESSGSVIHQTMGVDFGIDVVEILEERAIHQITEKEKSKASPIILVLIIIVLILAIVGFYFSRKKKTE